MIGRVVAVDLLTSYLRELFDTDPLLQDLWIEGEVAETFLSRSGHLYFTLCGAACRINCVIFRAELQRQLTSPRPGDHLAIHGRISLYDRDGTYQAYVDVVQPAGIGVRALEIERLRQKLEAEGLFEPTRKRPVPAELRCIGVVTSQQGAVWHDIQSTLRRRYPLAELVLSPAPVQGDGAAGGIVQALHRLVQSRRPDVIILARGGGSMDDLSCFNDEQLARAVFACPIPVVSAVGHESDWTIVDLIADLRASTPSAAAELCSPSAAELMERVIRHRDELRTRLGRQTSAHRSALTHGRGTLSGVALRQATARRGRELSWLSERLAGHRARLVADHRQELDGLAIRNAAGARLHLRSAGERAAGTAAVLHALGPVAVLNRGYAVVHLPGDARPVKDASRLSAGEPIVTVLASGVARSIVQATSPGPGIPGS